MENHLPELNSSNFTRNLDRAWDIRFVVKGFSHQSNQLDPDQKYEWLGCIGTKGWGTIEIIPSSINFAVFVPAHDLNDWTLLCWCENMGPEH